MCSAASEIASHLSVLHRVRLVTPHVCAAELLLIPSSRQHSPLFWLFRAVLLHNVYPKPFDPSSSKLILMSSRSELGLEAPSATVQPQPWFEARLVELVGYFSTNKPATRAEKDKVYLTSSLPRRCVS